MPTIKKSLLPLSVFSILYSLFPLSLHAAPPSTPDIPDLGAETPKALLESMVKVITDKSNPQAWLGFEPPANHDLAQKILDSAQQLKDKTAAVAQLVQTKIDSTSATMIRQTSGNGVQPGVEVELTNHILSLAPDGKINWDQTKIIENTDSARVQDNSGTDLLMIKVKNKWYLGEGATPAKETLALDAPANKQMTDQLMTVLTQLEQKLNANQLTKDNFIQEYSNLINQALSPPTTTTQ